MNLQYSSESGSALELEKAVSLPREKPKRPKRIPVKCRQRNRFIPVFLIGVAGLCVHTTAFFTKSFAQSFESIPQETIEALEVTGASRLSIFCNAILPAAFSQIVAWAGMRLETNFSECAILGMVGAGGIGYVISNSLQGYDYGTAGVAILLVFLIAYAIERLFVAIKKKFNS